MTFFGQLASLLAESKWPESERVPATRSIGLLSTPHVNAISLVR
jgi:hypothetical protein